MSQSIQIPQSEWHQLKEAIRSIKEFMQVDDLVNKEEAIKLLGVARQTWYNMKSRGEVTVASINDGGIEFFSKKQLYGIKRKHAIAYDYEMRMQDRAEDFNTYK